MSETIHIRENMGKREPTSMNIDSDLWKEVRKTAIDNYSVSLCILVLSIFFFDRYIHLITVLTICR
jgi:hypothetical protein